MSSRAQLWDFSVTTVSGSIGKIDCTCGALSAAVPRAVFARPPSDPFLERFPLGKFPFVVQQTSSGVQQTPSGVQQTSSGVQQTPSGVQQTPSGVQQTPSGVRQTPSGVQQTPSGVRQTPSGVQQTPSGVQPTPSGVQPTPSGVRQTPSGVWLFTICWHRDRRRPQNCRRSPATARCDFFHTLSEQLGVVCAGDFFALLEHEASGVGGHRGGGEGLACGHVE